MIIYRDEHMSTIPAVAKELREGRFVVIDGEPCKVVQIESSAPGKHGAAKMRIVGIGLFDSIKRTLLKPSDGGVEIPLVERKSGQVVSVSGDMAQLMDPETYEMYELKIPEELKEQVEAGKEVELMVTMGRKSIQKVR
jgi:translation initiation factor 5A